MGGHKGIGLAMLVECLAGSLSGMEPHAQAQDDGASAGAAMASAFLLVLDPALVAGAGPFERNVAHWVGQYLAAAGTGGRYPGQRQARCETGRSVKGIPFDSVLAAQLDEAAARVGMRFDVQRTA